MAYDTPEKAKAWRERNKEKLRLNRIKHYQDNKEAYKARSKAQQSAEEYKAAARERYHSTKAPVRPRLTIEQRRERERLRSAARRTGEDRAISIESKRRYKANNPDKVCASTAHRRAKAIQATPKWSDKFIIAEAYSLARLRNNVTGIKWHVDHIVPLRSKLVCGLHAHTNIRVIPAIENMRKNNKHWPDMP
jgi:hypothetical protein